MTFSSTASIRLEDIPAEKRSELLRNGSVNLSAIGAGMNPVRHRSTVCLVYWDRMKSRPVKEAIEARLAEVLGSKQ